MKINGDSCKHRFLTWNADLAANENLLGLAALTTNALNFNGRLSHKRRITLQASHLHEILLE